VPITPFHFGPGAAIHSASPRHISFLAFCAANVLIDVEPLYYMITGQFWLHRLFHTYIGATLVAMTTVLLFLGARRVARPLSLPDIFEWQQLSVRAVAIGAFLGTYSHVVLDSVMHADIRPFAPFSDTNPLLGIVSLRALHLFCLGAGAVGLAVVLVRGAMRQPGRT
jgi:membrane-bound metal-dependent hydrolase YbcI (DUF457 family)